MDPMGDGFEGEQRTFLQSFWGSRFRWDELIELRCCRCWLIEAQVQFSGFKFNNKTHRIHVWYIYLHLVVFWMVNVGKYTIHGCYGKAPKKQKRFEGNLVFLVAESSSVFLRHHANSHLFSLNKTYIDADSNWDCNEGGGIRHIIYWKGDDFFEDFWQKYCLSCPSKIQQIHTLDI